MNETGEMGRYPLRALRFSLARTEALRTQRWSINTIDVEPHPHFLFLLVHSAVSYAQANHIRLSVRTHAHVFMYGYNLLPNLT